MDKPRLRDVSLQSAVINGSPMILLKDPEHFSEQTLCIPENEAMLFILSRLDGEHSIVDIQADFMRRFGTLLMSDQIRSIVNTLSENHFLDDEEFHAYRNSVIESFRESPVRTSLLAGTSYPADPGEIKNLLDSFIQKARCSVGKEIPGPREQPRALIAPHIDFARGGRVYGAIYDEILAEEMPDLFVLLGTVHSPASSLFIPTRKSFETPLGVAETDTDVLHELERCLPPEKLYGEDFVHQGEHSIEFQILWLQHIYSGRRISILPILCSSFQNFIFQRMVPDLDPEFSAFLSGLKSVLEKSGKNLMVIAGADLSHVGSSFGDPFARGVPDAFLEQVRRHDQTLLETIGAGDAHLFFDTIASRNDCYRVCGLPPIYALLMMLPIFLKSEDERKITGKLIDYDQSLDQERTTSVSFAGMAFY